MKDTKYSGLETSVNALIDLCVDNRVGPCSPAAMAEFWVEFDLKYPEIAQRAANDL